MKIIIFSIYIFIVINLSIGDTIELKNGRILQGLIINSSGKKISLKQDTIVRLFFMENIKFVTRVFSMENIKSITFSRADILLLKNGQNLICKVVNENDDDIIISLAQGVDSLNKDNVAEIIYNKAPELQIYFLPETGQNFINEEPEPVIEFKKSIYVKTFFGRQSGHVKDNTEEFFKSNIEDLNMALNWDITLHQRLVWVLVLKIMYQFHQGYGKTTLPIYILSIK